MRTIEVVDRGAAAHPHRPALVDEQETLSYVQVRDLSCRIAQRLHVGQYAVGTHGAVLAPNEARGFVVSLGLLRAGVTWIPVNPRDAPKQIGHVLDLLDVEILFVHSSFAPELEQLRAAAPRIREVVTYDQDLDEWLEDAPAEDVTVTDDPEAIVAIFPTSGTTGLPRGVMHSNRSFGAFMAGLPVVMPHPEGPPTYLAAAPLTHASGRIALSMMGVGGTTVVLKQAAPSAILEAFARQSITMTMLPPTVIYGLVQEPDIAAWEQPALKYILYGSAPMRLDILKSALKAFGPVMHHGYGQTEAPLLIAAMSAAEHVPGGQAASDERLRSVGRPTPYSQVSIRGPEDNELQCRDVGEICVRGDFIMSGYYKDPDATAQALRGGWLHTGDLGYLDADGYLHIVDRMKDMIISGGFNVYSAEVERVIAAMPAVAEVAVIGIPHDRWGETVTAVVVPRLGQRLTAAEVVARCKEQLGSVKAPKTVVFRDDLPRNLTGKVLKRELRDDYVPV